MSYIGHISKHIESASKKSSVSNEGTEFKESSKRTIRKLVNIAQSASQMSMAKGCMFVEYSKSTMTTNPDTLKTKKS